MTNFDLLQLTPKTALVVYERASGNVEAPNGADVMDYYVETHSIHATPEGRHVLGEGSPITYEALGQLAQAFEKKAASLGTVSGLFPANLLFAEQTPGRLRMLWYDPPQPRTFLGNGNLTVTAPAPGMLYYLSNEQLYVLATDAPDRPDVKTWLYSTGWSNIGAGGLVCIGNTVFQRQNPTYTRMIEQWTAAFWHSSFTGLTKESAEYKRLQKLATSGDPYPVDQLKKFKSFVDFTASASQ